MGKKQGNLQTSVYQILYSHHYDAPAFIKVIVNNAIDLFESNQLESATPFKMVGYSRRAPNTLRAHWNELKCRWFLSVIVGSYLTNLDPQKEKTH